MRQSRIFIKTQKEEARNEPSLNAQLLLRAGFVNKEMAGVYSFLPLGLKVLRNIEEIVRKGMIKELGAQEVLMPALHPLKNYEITERDNIDVLFHTELSAGGSLVLGQSHEEIIAPLLKRHISSYRDLPLGVFQIQTKFRNEERAKSGILRGREFLMKDLYSFHTSEDDLIEYYERAKGVYRDIFRQLGIGDRTYLTYSDGGTFSEYSHEFQALAEAGEDEIYLCRDCEVAVNKEIIEDQSRCPQCDTPKDELDRKKSIEVGNIFPLYRKFSDPFELRYKNEKGEDRPIFMGCYGIGISRVMGAIVEMMSDDAGMVWPEEVAPYKVHLLSLNKNKEAESIYRDLSENGVEVLFDDREKSPGEKLVESDLLGIPYRVVVSERTLKEDSVEIKKRKDEEGRLIKTNKIKEYVEEDAK